MPIINSVDKNISEINPFLKNIFQNSLSSPIFSHLLNFNYSLHTCCQQTYNKLFSFDLPDLDILLSSTIIDKSVWLKLRQFRITGSRIYDIFTYSKNNAPNWEKKSKSYFWPKSFTNKFIKYGKKFESVARNKYIEKTGNNVVECGLLLHDLEKWVGYSPDGVVVNNDVPTKLIEIKCPYDGKILNAEALKNNVTFLDEFGNLRKRHKFYGQVQMGLAMLNLQSADFIIYSSFDDNIEIINVDFDQEFADNLMTTAKHSFFNYMLHEICKNT